jgi:uncharacterized protein
MRKIGFGNQCLIALVLGLVLGHYMSDNVISFVAPFGEAFIKLLKLVIVPLTFSTIVASFSRLGSISLIEKLGLSTLIWFLITALIAATIGVAVGTIFSPGVGLHLDANVVTQYKPREIPSISGTLLNMLPGNLIQDIAEGRIIPVIIFAIFFGIALTALHDKGQHVKTFFSEFSEIMFKITRVIIRLSPIGIFALIAQISHDSGIETLMPLAKFIIAIYVACGLQLLVYALLVIFAARKNPITFFRQFYPAMITAFTTSSSLGTLPVTLERLVDNVGIRPQVAGFVAPLGATMKMDGCGGIFPAIVCILTANIFHIDLSLQQYIMIILTSAIATIGTAGVPGTASIMATVVLVSVGLPLEGLALIIGIDKVVDTIRTMTNVTGSGVCTLIVDQNYKE